MKLISPSIALKKTNKQSMPCCLCRPLCAHDFTLTTVFITVHNFTLYNPNILFFTTKPFYILGSLSLHPS